MIHRLLRNAWYKTGRIKLLLSVTFLFQIISLQAQIAPPDSLLIELNRSGIIRSKDDSLVQVKNLRIDSAKIKNQLQELRNENLRSFSEKKLRYQHAVAVAALIKECERISIYFRKGIDTSGLAREFNVIDQRLIIAADGIFYNRGSAHTLRNLSTSELLLIELSKNLDRANSKLQSYRVELDTMRQRLDSLAVDSFLYQTPGDSAYFNDFITDLKRIKAYVTPADSLLEVAESQLSELENKSALLGDKLLQSIRFMDETRLRLSKNLSSRDFPDLSEEASYSRPLNEIISYSRQKLNLVLIFYLKNNIAVLLLLILAGLFLYYLLYSLSERSPQAKPEDPVSIQMLIRFPGMSSLFIILNIGQFAFPNPPFIIHALFWLSAAILLTFFIKQQRSASIFISWMSFFTLVLLVILNNFVLQASRPERWLLLALALCGLLLTLRLWKQRKEWPFPLSYSTFFILLFALFMFISATANYFGRYNLSKTLLNSGYFALFTGILLNRTLQMINASLTLGGKVLQGSRLQRKMFRSNTPLYEGPLVISIAFIAGWLLLSFRQFYWYEIVSRFIGDLLHHPIQLGNFSFTVINFIYFISVLYVSGILSNIISFYANNTRDADKPDRNQGGIGSWVLLIRIAIYSIGTLLAFAAAGIPMDKLTIILGSLGVGIGFGLQNIVNNLFSGIIIAFEKPFRPGDQIEIDGKSGYVKEIGIRSSQITTYDGADVIIPNGDMLNHHLTNWTRNRNTRRSELIVKVKTGTSIQRVKDLINEILRSGEGVLKFPEPSVSVFQYSENSIDLKVYFWADIDHWIRVRSQLLQDIDEKLHAEGIEVPVRI